MNKNFKIKTVSELRNFLRKEILKEAGVKKDNEDSLDSQVDRYLASYESDSKVVKKESYDFRQSVRNFLTEVEDDAEGGDESKDDSLKNLKLEDINMENFINNVMRLVSNYDNLLEIRDTILKRASNYLAENYDSETVKSFKDNLLDMYSVEIGKSHNEFEDKETKRKAPLVNANKGWSVRGVKATGVFSNI